MAKLPTSLLSQRHSSISSGAAAGIHFLDRSWSISSSSRLVCSPWLQLVNLLQGSCDKSATFPTVDCSFKILSFLVHEAYRPIVMYDLWKDLKSWPLVSKMPSEEQVQATIICFLCAKGVWLKLAKDGLKQRRAKHCILHWKLCSDRFTPFDGRIFKRSVEKNALYHNNQKTGDNTYLLERYPSSS